MSDATYAIRRRRWTAAEDDAIRQHYGTMAAADIGALIDRTADAIWIRAAKLGLGKREEVHDPWTEAELDEVRRCYASEQVRDIAKRLGRTPAAVSQQAVHLGLTGRKAVITQATVHDYFSHISTVEQAYVLGLIAADGNVATGHPRVQFGLQARDVATVKFVRDRLNPCASLLVRPNGHTEILLTSRQMVADLARVGILPRKSHILQWPTGLGELLRPFLLGHFDGDGWIHAIRNRYPGWGTCSGSEQFLIDMKEYIRESTGVVLEKIHRRPGTNLYQVATTGRGAWIVNEWLHHDGLGMARKRHPEHLLSQYRLVR